MFVGDETTYSTEVGRLVETKLCDLPPVLKRKESTYDLRGVVSYIPGLSRLRTAVGHYKAYCKRGERSWELMDDLNKKTVSVKGTTKVNCEYIIYTI